MAVHTCPRCQLRFAARAEMCDHLVVDHEFGVDSVGIKHLVSVGGRTNRQAPNPLSGGNAPL